MNRLRLESPGSWQFLLKFSGQIAAAMKTPPVGHPETVVKSEGISPMKCPKNAGLGTSWSRIFKQYIYHRYFRSRFHSFKDHQVYFAQKVVIF